MVRTDRSGMTATWTALAIGDRSSVIVTGGVVNQPRGGGRGCLVWLTERSECGVRVIQLRDRIHLIPLGRSQIRLPLVRHAADIRHGESAWLVGSSAAPPAGQQSQKTDQNRCAKRGRSTHQDRLVKEEDRFGEGPISEEARVITGIQACGKTDSGRRVEWVQERIVARWGQAPFRGRTASTSIQSLPTPRIGA